jgi:hypothetical protein
MMVKTLMRYTSAGWLRLGHLPRVAGVCYKYNYTATYDIHKCGETFLARNRILTPAYPLSI